MPRSLEHSERLRRALLSLDGLSIGDAFGERFFGYPKLVLERIEQRALPAAPWKYTDDTEMALAIVEVLDNHERIDQNALAVVFGRRYAADPTRGYGGTAHDILQAFSRGASWRDISPRVFGGQGSMGNGSAMRVAPVGAYFADDWSRVIEEARASAEVTHTHPEGLAGGVVTALAAACAVDMHRGRLPREPSAFFKALRDAAPDSMTRRYVEAAANMPLETRPADAAERLGSGQQVLTVDTVPFCLWCAARHLDDYQAALWTTVAGLGDRDTTCAIVGGIVALSAGEASIPAAFQEAREPLAIELPVATP
ncbi:MAG: ADP-ribosylglycohydrolase family protein [Polyangiaceae bacterium]|nr:ADP-ribosylglycohydrolase family protein [Polyangiaceae bacterium]